MMRRPSVLRCDTDGLVHYVAIFDAVRWHPYCSIMPRSRPKGWKKQSDDQPVTCLACLVDDRFMP